MTNIKNYQEPFGFESDYTNYPHMRVEITVPEKLVKISDIESWMRSWEAWSLQENIDSVKDSDEHKANERIHHTVLTVMRGLVKALKEDKQFEDYIR